MLTVLDEKERSVCIVVKQQLFEWLHTHAMRSGNRIGKYVLGLVKDGIRSRMSINEIIADLNMSYQELEAKYIAEFRLELMERIRSKNN